jgi:DNA-binding NarL/FixJ family response regulator
VNADPHARVRVLLADDHAVVRLGLRSLLADASDMSVVGEARDGEEALAAWQRLRPDVALIDLKMPRFDGLWAVRAIRACDPQARILVLTSLEGDEIIHQALQAGASGYLFKDVTPAELGAALREVARGGNYVSPAVARQLATRADFEDLTRRELDILALLAEGRSNRGIAERLSISEGTVKLHVRSLLSKFRACSRSEIIAIGARRGFIRRG